MEVVAYSDPSKFWEVVRPLYEADPLRHTIALTVLQSSSVSKDHGRPPLLLAVQDEGRLVGAAFQTPPWPLGVSGLTAECVPAVAAYLHERRAQLPAVAGPSDVSAEMARAWAERAQVKAELNMAMRLHRLATLEMPVDVDGALRFATDAEAPLLRRWMREFARVVNPSAPDGDEESDDFLADRVKGLWTVGGVPVSFAAASTPTRAMSRIGPVYTPTDHRGNGYGSAVTAAMSQWALDAGAEDVVLFTDLANPTSNKIYAGIGYVPLYDSAEYRFTATV